MPVISVANRRPRPSRLNESDKPSDGAHGSSRDGRRPGRARSNSLPKSTASAAGHAASIPIGAGTG